MIRKKYSGCYGKEADIMKSSKLLWTLAGLAVTLIGGFVTNKSQENDLAMMKEEIKSEIMKDLLK